MSSSGAGKRENGPVAPAAGVRPALRRYRVMALVVGVGLLILCLEVLLHYGFDNDALAWWSPIHGLLYMAYLVTTADLGFRARWSLPRMVAVMLAGVVPLFSFVMERRVAREVAASSILAR
jgi:integral membrane protein